MLLPPLIASVLALAQAGGAPQQAAPPRPPNIVLIVADDLHRDVANFTAEGRGRNCTPTLDRLAREGVVMTGQRLVSPLCTPSRYSCLTGRYASRARNDAFVALLRRAGTTVVTWNTLLLPDDVTLPKLLHDAGYATGAVGKQHCFQWGGIEKVAADDDPRDPVVAAKLRANQERAEAVLKRCGYDEAASIYRANVLDGVPRELGVHNMEWVTQGAVDFIDRHAHHPFFLWFAPTLLHTPTDPGALLAADPLATPGGYLAQAPDVQPARRTIVPRGRASGVTDPRLPAAMLWLDDAIGAIVLRLEQHGIAGDTLILFVNDNGQEGKGSVYELGTHYPSVLWRKGGFACGHECDLRVTNLDFAPTLLELAGVAAPAGQFDGKSFAAALRGDATPIHDALFFEVGFTRAVLQGSWKYVALRFPPAPQELIDQRPPERGRGTAQPDPAAPPGLVPAPPYGHVAGDPSEDWNKSAHPGYWDADQLYDLASDPDEKVNLAARPEHAERLAAMKRLLSAHLETLPGGFGELKPAK